jgi:ribulose 1,5-bisphosphate synthetase/thiazole synthase
MPVYSRLAVAIQLLCVLISPALSVATNQQYDYVIVGGGITGLVVANRLSEDKKSMFNLNHCLYELSRMVC